MTTAAYARGRAGPARVGASLAAYVALTKPRIIELLLVTTVPTMFAQRGVPSLWLVVATLVGGTLSAGSANAFNMVYDRDIDAHMGRTANRPLVTGAGTPRVALIFASALAVISTVWFAVVVNALGGAVARGDHPVCRGLHDDPQAPHLPKHRVGRRCRLYAGADRLVGRSPPGEWAAGSSSW